MEGNWIDEASSYPWRDPAARELHRQLTGVFHDPAEIRALVLLARKPNVSKIAFHDRSVYQIWVDILERAASEGGLRELLTHVRSEADRRGYLEVSGVLRGLLEPAA